MKRLLLISSSAVHGSGYLEHCADRIVEHLDSVQTVLFVPYALHDHDAYADQVGQRLGEIGFALDSIHRAADPVAAVEKAEAVFIGGGNTFRLLKTLYDRGLVEPLRARARSGMPYMGSSAGSNVAGATIMTTNDMPIVYPPTFEALGLVSFQLNPHYVDPDPHSTHKGETRETRIREFLEENTTPVVGIREGALLVARGEDVRLAGRRGGRLFRRGHEPLELEDGTLLGPLLAV